MDMTTAFPLQVRPAWYFQAGRQEGKSNDEF